MKIGIVGFGILGQAIHEALRDTYELVIIDPPKGHFGDIEDLNYFILCLPTPENEDGSCDTSLVEFYIKALNGKKVLLKSTVDPKVLLELADEYDFTYSPEFLREASSKEDFQHQEFAIFAGEDDVQWFETFEHAGVTMDKHIFTSIKIAVYAKYTINTFLATKVAFFNELYELMGDQKEYDELVTVVQGDSRIGKSHMQVPGPDGEKGFGGMCFPKDTKAFSHYAKSVGGSTEILDQVIETNEKIR